MSLRDRILAADDIQCELVTVPEWDGVEIEVRSLSGRQRSQFIERVEAAQGDFSTVLPKLLVIVCYDPDTGERVFKDQDIEALLEKSAAVLDRIGREAMRISGLGQEAERDLGNA